MKIYEVVLFNNIFVQLSRSSFGSFFLVFPSRRLSVTFEIQIDLKIYSKTLEANSEPYSEPIQTSKVKVFGEIVNGFWFLTIFAKSSILDVWQDSEFTSEASNDFAEKAPSQMFDRFLNLSM